jgi:aminoacylase
MSSSSSNNNNTTTNNNSLLLPNSKQEIHLFQQLLQFRTVSGEGPITGSYQQCANFIANYLQQQQQPGLSVLVKEYVQGKPIVLATLKGRNESLPGILFNAHYDVVPANVQHWTVDPWAAIIKDNKIYGRGTQDMKCVVAQYLLALTRLLKKRNNQPFLRTVHFSFVPDEEIGGQDGMVEFLRSPEFINQVQPLALALDEGLANTGNAFTMFYGERAPLWIILKATGPTGHGSRFIESTAVERLLNISHEAMEFRKQEEDVFRGKRKSEGCAHCEAHRLGDVCTLNITMLKAGVPMAEGPPIMFQGEEKIALNVIPTEARMGMDIRVPPHVPIEQITSMMDNWCTKQGNVSWAFAPWTSPVDRHAVTSIDPVQNPFYAKFLECIQDKYGVKVIPEVFPAGTDSRFIRELNIPAFGFSPIRNSPILLHEHDEWIGVGTFMEGIDVYEVLMEGLLEFNNNNNGEVVQQQQQLKEEQNNISPNSKRIKQG